MCVIALDWDGVCSTDSIQRLARKLSREHNEIWIITMRRESDYNLKEMMPALAKIGLSAGSIIFCNNKPKWELLKAFNVDIYIDNITDEFGIINEQTNTVPLLYKNIN